MSSSFYDALVAAEARGPAAKLYDVFAEEPVDLTTFVQDAKFMRNPPLSPPQYEAVRHLEQIYYPELYHLMAEEWGHYWVPVRFINQCILEWGKGSGKDHICRVASMRVGYLLCCLKSPQSYYGMPEQDSIHLLNVAMSAKQANKVFFKPMKEAAERKGSWFAEHCDSSAESIMYDKNVEALSGHSDAETQEGLNLMLAVADEIDGFRSKTEMNLRSSPREPSTSAESILEMLDSSASTRFPEVYKLMVISYPRYLGSKIQQLRQEAHDEVARLGEASTTYVDGPRATWEVNPRVKGPEAFVAQYRRNPSAARAKYECKPERAQNPFFANKMAVKASFSRVLKREPILIDYHFKDFSWEVRFIIADDFVPIQGALYAMHGDIGIRKDRAGVAMSHVRTWQEQDWVGQDEEEGDVFIHEARPIVKVDFVTSFSADLAAQPVPREVQIRWYRELAFELIRRGFLIKTYTFDGFQSTDALQILAKRGIETKAVSTDKSPDVWNVLRDVSYDGRLEAYVVEDTSEDDHIVLRELLALNKLSNGKVDHPLNGSKDEADAFAASIYGAVLLGGREAVDDRGNPTRAYLNSGIDFGVPGANIDLPYGMGDAMTKRTALVDVKETDPETRVRLGVD